MIYFDNAATTFPKPKEVRNTISSAPMIYGANPGRGGYEMSINTAGEIFNVRTKIASLFNADSEENVIFTMNCTYALNMAIKGLAKKGGHAVTSCVEHNSVLRPLHKLQSDGWFSYDTAEIYYDDEKTIRSFKRKLKANTNFIVCTYASNVFGDILPIKKIGELAEKYGIPLIVDAAQAAGVIDIDVKRDNISCLCLPGHKGLYGPTGTGVLITNNGILPDTIIEGGTGSESKNLFQPDFIPDRYESGTLNTCGIIALGKGVDFVKRKSIAEIRKHEEQLVSYLFKKLEEIPGIITYNSYIRDKYVPVASFNVKGISSEECASRLAGYSVAVRGGYHCNASAHRFYGTESLGTVRVSLSAFNTKEEIDFLIKCLIKIAKSVNM